jgi:hypothetical protein
LEYPVFKISQLILNLEPPVLQSAKQSHHGSFSPDVYKTFNPTPPPRPSNSKHSHFGLGNPIYKKFQVTTQHKTTFQDHPPGF